METATWEKNETAGPGPWMMKYCGAGGEAPFLLGVCRGLMAPSGRDSLRPLLPAPHPAFWGPSSLVTSLVGAGGAPFLQAVYSSQLQSKTSICFYKLLIPPATIPSKTWQATCAGQVLFQKSTFFPRFSARCLSSLLT